MLTKCFVLILFKSIQTYIQIFIIAYGIWFGHSVRHSLFFLNNLNSRIFSSNFTCKILYLHSKQLRNCTIRESCN